MDVQVQSRKFEGRFQQASSEASLDCSFPVREGYLSPKLISDEAAIFLGAQGGEIGGRIVDSLGASAGKGVFSSFPNSETRIEIHESVRDKHVFVIAQIGSPVNEGLIQTALTIQALKLADARKVTVVLPYFPYSRQDRKVDTRPPISSKLVTDLLKISGAHQIVTVDLHATQVEGFFDGPFENLQGLNQLVKPVIEAEGASLVICSPDAGGAKRAEKFARSVEKITDQFTPLVVMSKFRPGPSTPPIVTLSVGSDFIDGKTCVLVDDMIDTGGSIVAAARALKEKGAARVIVCATHGVFSDNAIERLLGGRDANGDVFVDHVYVTDTLPLPSLPSNFVKVVSISPLIAEAISRLDQPKGSLYELRERTDLGELIPSKWT